MGYVEDEESVEMIEKKFEVLEQFSKQQSVTTPSLEFDQQEVEITEEPEILSEQQMEDMFKNTSYFSIKDTSPLSTPLESNEISELNNRYWNINRIIFLSKNLNEFHKFSVIYQVKVKENGVMKYQHLDQEREKENLYKKRFRKK